MTSANNFLNCTSIFIAPSVFFNPLFTKFLRINYLYPMMKTTSTNPLLLSPRKALNVAFLRVKPLPFTHRIF